MKNVLYLFCCLLFTCCGKQFLDVKYDSRLVVPTTISDYQALLNKNLVFNNQSCHELGIIGADEYYLLDGRLATLTNPYQRNGYVWAQEVYEGNEVVDWNRAYLRILHANIALEGIDNLIPQQDGIEEWNDVRGSALFIRAHNHYQLAQLFCKAYDAETATTDPGIPLRLESDINISPVRSSIAETYRHIIADLSAAASLLPDVGLNNRCPSKAAAYALLAKTCLQTGDFEQGAEYARLSLAIRHTLLDFNALGVDGAEPFPNNPIANDSQPEILYFFTMPASAIIASGRINIDTVLLASYQTTDLRKRAYFTTHTNGSIVYKGSDAGGGLYGAFFTGLAVDEVLLIHAECLARLGRQQEALDDLNYLLKNRYTSEDFVPVTASSGTGLLEMILLERRKELVLRGVRWEDLRRLNKEASFRKDLQRNIDGQSYHLPAGDNRWVWPIPPSSVKLSGMEQNLR